MSKQLAISSALSVMAMTAMVLFGTAPAPGSAFAPSLHVSAPAVTAVTSVLITR